MTQYSKILVAIDLSSESRQVVAASRNLVGDETDKLHLFFILQPMTTAYPFASYTAVLGDVEAKATSSARQSLMELAAEFDIPPENIGVALGTPGSDISHQAKEVAADLIVLGSHGSTGLRMLLGSTTTAVLNSAECDVLTVRIRSKE